MTYRINLNGVTASAPTIIAVLAGGGVPVIIAAAISGGIAVGMLNDRDIKGVIVSFKYTYGPLKNC